MFKIDDSLFLKELNERIACHKTSFAGPITQEVLKIHREAWPFDTHFDPISGRFQYNQKFDDTYLDLSKGTFGQRFFAGLIGVFTPKGDNRPITGHITKTGFDRSFGGGASSGHANPHNLSFRLLGDPWERIKGEKAFLAQLVESDPNYALCVTPAEVRAAKQANKTALVFAVEGAHALGNPPSIFISKSVSEAQRKDRLESLKKDLGAAYLTLDHYCATDMSRAGICINPLSRWFWTTCGLTPFGKEIVNLAFDVGLLIDVAHSATQSVLDVCAQAQARGVPVFASHSGSQEIMQGFKGIRTKRVKRTLTFDSVKAIVKTGGCISVILGTQFLVNARYSHLRWQNDAHLSVYLEH